MGWWKRLMAWIDWNILTKNADKGWPNYGGKPPRKPRATMPRATCPACRKTVAYSTSTHLTQPHHCTDGHAGRVQKTIVWSPPIDLGIAKGERQ